MVDGGIVNVQFLIISGVFWGRRKVGSFLSEAAEINIQVEQLVHQFSCGMRNESLYRAMGRKPSRFKSCSTTIHPNWSSPLRTAWGTIQVSPVGFLRLQPDSGGGPGPLFLFDTSPQYIHRHKGLNKVRLIYFHIHYQGGGCKRLHQGEKGSTKYILALPHRFRRMLKQNTGIWFIKIFIIYQFQGQNQITKFR